MDGVPYAILVLLVYITYDKHIPSQIQMTLCSQCLARGEYPRIIFCLFVYIVLKL